MRKKWDKEEELCLVKMREDRREWTEIAKNLGSTIQSVKRRYHLFMEE